MVETREQQGRYMTSVEDFQASRRVLSVQARMLVDSLSWSGWTASSSKPAATWPAA
ncbi:hypothetical protein [Methylogaea oryzae]|uniref:hypothetical protein n=1 Tax=Methylogaea oryzae TaxID=1295382 RepID=UPI00159BDE0A|nr:hypothetical protein [Methylogaea oryzae]